MAINVTDVNLNFRIFFGDIGINVTKKDVNLYSAGEVTLFFIAKR